MDISYEIRVRYLEDDNCFEAYSPSFPFLSAKGETEEIAVKEFTLLVKNLYNTN